MGCPCDLNESVVACSRSACRIRRSKLESAQPKGIWELRRGVVGERDANQGRVASPSEVLCDNGCRLARPYDLDIFRHRERRCPSRAPCRDHDRVSIMRGTNRGSDIDPRSTSRVDRHSAVHFSSTQQQRRHQNTLKQPELPLLTSDSRHSTDFFFALAGQYLTARPSTSIYANICGLLPQT